MEILDEPASQFVIAVLLVTGIWYITKQRNSSSRPLPGTQVPPCLKSVPILGSLPFMSVDQNNMHEFFMEKSTKLGNVFALHLGSR